MHIGRAGTGIYDIEIFKNELLAIDIENDRSSFIYMTLTSIFAEARARSNVDDASSARDRDRAGVLTQLFGEMQAQTFHSPRIRSALTAMVTKFIRLAAIVALHTEGEALGGGEEESEDQAIHFYSR